MNQNRCRPPPRLWSSLNLNPTATLIRCGLDCVYGGVRDTNHDVSSVKASAETNCGQGRHFEANQKGTINQAVTFLACPLVAAPIDSHYHSCLVQTVEG